MSAVLKIMGCGSSGGVPRIGNQWGACDPSNPKNRRRRSCALFEKTTDNGTTRVLIDTSPDLRAQLLDADVRHVDAVIFTHDHADHTHGIDELRVLALLARKRVPVYFNAATAETLKMRFAYCFKSAQTGYPPILDGQVIEPGQEIVVKGAGGKLKITPFAQVHGPIVSLGMKCGGLVYSSDISDMPDASLGYLKNVETWVVDALRYEPHPCHFSFSDALRWIERIAPQRAILTHMHVDLDYETVMRDTPEHVVPAYDGMTVPFNDA